MLCISLTTAALATFALLTSTTLVVGKSLPIKPFKDTIKAALVHLHEHQNAGVSSSDLVKNFTWMMDELVTIIWDNFAGLAEDHKLELVAVGGYGRGELHPQSDVDLLILLEHNNYDDIKDFVENFIRFLWDIGLEIGHSVRVLQQLKVKRVVFFNEVASYSATAPLDSLVLLRDLTLSVRLMS